MTKNQTIDLLKSQLPGFYSVEQVINLIEKIEDDSSRKITTNNIAEAIDKVVNWIDRNQDEVFEFHNAEFELDYNNQIRLTGIPVDTEAIKEVLENEFMDFGEVEDDFKTFNEAPYGDD
jgi:hemerythrin-like domain-containing protein